MPKKKGSGKLAKMTEEERMLYLEQQRLAEEELRKKKEDMLVVYLKVCKKILKSLYWVDYWCLSVAITLPNLVYLVAITFSRRLVKLYCAWLVFYLTETQYTASCILTLWFIHADVSSSVSFTEQEKLAKEEKASKFNLSKLHHQWRNIMREAKSRELKKDIEILSQTFERIVDRKESVIKSLAKDVSEAEEQYAMALRSHLTNVDKLVGKKQCICLSICSLQIRCIVSSRRTQCGSCHTAVLITKCHKHSLSLQLNRFILFSIRAILSRIVWVYKFISCILFSIYLRRKVVTKMRGVLLDLQMERLDTLQSEYDEELEILKQEFDTGRSVEL